MPVNTPGGWPYLLPSDHPIEYAAQSQTMASKLEAEVPGQTLGTWTPVAPWLLFGGTLEVTKLGRLVTCSGMLKPSSTQSLAAGAAVNIGTLPAGMNPASAQTGYAVALHSVGYSVGQAYVSGATIQFVPVAALSVTASGYIGISLTFRSAT